MGRATGKNNPNLGALELLRGLYETLGGAARGVTSATLGMPGDLEGLLRMLTPGVSNEPFLPNTERVSKYVPGPDNTMSELGRNLPLTPTQTAKLGRPVAQHAAELIHRGMMGEGPLKGALQAVAPMNVIKPRGGNWLPGSSRHNIENILKDELRTNGIGEEEFMDLYRNDPNQVNEARKGYENAKVMDQWIQGPLRKYIMRDMATESDPIRKLADQGILHVDPQELNFNLSNYGKWPLRDQTFHAKSDAAKAWEGASDNSIGITPRWQLSPEPGSSKLSREQPWIDKLPEETPFYSINEPQAFLDDLGLDRLQNTVYESLVNGELRPEQLQSGSFGVEAAVRHAHQKRMAELAKQEAELLKNSRNAATFTHKEYPGPDNPDGYHWVQIRKPEGSGKAVESKWPGQETLAQNEANLRNPHQDIADLQKALTHEGDVMGHCVGDYCDQVSRGEVGIYSLRDKSGKSHVTVETRKPAQSITEAEQAFYNEHDRLPRDMQELDEWGMENDIQIDAEDFGQTPKEWRIQQIKGSGKKDSMQRILPEDLPKFQPYIQDFLNSQPWSDVRDLKNSGLVNMHDLYGERLPQGSKRYMTPAEQQEFNRLYPDLKSKLSDEVDNMGDWEVEFANGGLVQAPDYFNDLDAFLARN